MGYSVKKTPSIYLKVKLKNCARCFFYSSLRRVWKNSEGVQKQICKHINVNTWDEKLFRKLNKAKKRQGKINDKQLKKIHTENIKLSNMNSWYRSVSEIYYESNI